MKHVVLYIAAASALRLISTRDRVSPVSLSAKPSKTLSLVSQYLKGGVTRKALVEAAEASRTSMTWESAVSNLKHQMPKEIVSILDSKKGSVARKQPFDEAALDKARMTLNGMIETAEAEYDLKDMECRAFEERNRMEFEQTVADLSRLGSNIADDNAKILAAKADIGNAIEMIDIEQKALESAMGECEKTRLMNEMQLQTLENDLAVAEFIVKMTECKEGDSLLQASTVPQIEGCPMEDGTVHLSFKDGFLKNKAGMLLSDQGRQALRVALLNSHPGLDNSTREALNHAVAAANKQISTFVMRARVTKQNPPKEKGPPPKEAPPSLSDIMNPPKEAAPPVPPKTEPDLEAAANKCVLGKPDCGLLNDNMAMMWGEVKDAVDELTSIMAENEKQCQETEKMHNGVITTWQAALSQKNVELTEATGSLNTNTEEQSERQSEKLMIEKEYEEVHGECEAVLHEILFTNICGVKTVRGEIAKFSSVYGPTDVLDCVVTDWIPEECSIACIDQVLCEGAAEGELPHPSCAGGTQNMTRNIVQNKTLGAECPALLLTKGCNNFPCPINCEQSSWSPFGKCSKECGGGIEARSRNVEVRPDNGGEACGPSSDTQVCNTQSCDVDCVLHDWTPWGPCSRACAGGVQERARLIASPAEGKGLCAAEESEERFEQQECNVMACPEEPICQAKQDVVFGIDVSGSLKQEGFDTMMAFARDLMSLYILGANDTQIGILEYSKTAKIVAPLQNDMEALMPMLDKVSFQRGVTDMAQGFSLAKTILMEGRKSASSVVVLLTDGKPSFQFSTRKAAQELRDGGVRVVVVPVFTYGDADFMTELASDPPEDNVLPINGLKHLANATMDEAKKLMTSTCAELQQEEVPAETKQEMVAAIFNPPRPHKHEVKRIYHRRGHNPYHKDFAA